MTIISQVTMLGVMFLCCSSFILFESEMKGEEKCCESCKLPEIKYYSIVNPRCGESCLDPKDYWKYKIFEPGMKKAESNTPCLDFNFPSYEETEIHHIGNLKVAVDLYLKKSN